MLQNRSHSIILLIYIAEEFLCSFFHAHNMSYQIVNVWYQCTVLSSGSPCKLMHYYICVCLYCRMLHVFHRINFATLYAMSLQASLEMLHIYIYIYIYIYVQYFRSYTNFITLMDACTYWPATYIKVREVAISNINSNLDQYK